MPAVALTIPIVLLLLAALCFVVLYLRNRDPLYLGLILWVAAEIVKDAVH